MTRQNGVRFIAEYFCMVVFDVDEPRQTIHIAQSMYCQ